MRNLVPIVSLLLRGDFICYLDLVQFSRRAHIYLKRGFLIKALQTITGACSRGGFEEENTSHSKIFEKRKGEAVFILF